MKNKKLIALVCCLALLVGAAGATLAWLTDKTETVTNTFTAGNIDITLTEDGAVDADGILETLDKSKSYKMIPGDTLKKDPTVTVETGSEACWVFVKVEKTANFDQYLSYEIDGDWTKLEETAYSAVYYIKQDDLLAEDDVNAVYPVLEGNVVTVKPGVTKGMMDALEGDNVTLPNISFKAYAIQQDNLAYDEADTDAEKAAVAWTVLNTPVEP